MNILFIGPYRQRDEWGHKSRAVLSSLHNTSHSITARPIFLSSDAQYDEYSEIAEFQTKDHYDILIQFLLQPYAIYDGRVSKRVGIFNAETIPHNIPLGCLTKELLMDEVWTDSPTIQHKLQLELNKYSSNTKVVAIPPALNVDGLPENTHGSLLSSDTTLKNRFIFYYIGNPLDEKGGFKETCQAYLNTFSSIDSVAFIVAPEAAVDSEALSQLMEECRSGLGNIQGPTKQPLIHIINTATGALSAAERTALHIEGDCLVSPAYSMAISSLVLEAALYHSMPIINKGNACYEWWGEKHFWGIDSYEECCITQQRIVPYRFMSNESWHKPVILSLGQVMKQTYINKFQRDQKIKANTELREYFKTNNEYENIL